MSTSWSGTSGDENSEQFQDFSQELRFAGSYANLDYLVGGFYANEYLRQNQQLLFGTAYNPLINEALISAIRARCVPMPDRAATVLRHTNGPVSPPGSGDVDQYRQRTDSYSLLHQRDLSTSRSKFEINVGARYTIDNKVDNSLNQNTERRLGGRGLRRDHGHQHGACGRSLGQQPA